MVELVVVLMAKQLLALVKAVEVELNLLVVLHLHSTVRQQVLRLLVVLVKIYIAVLLAAAVVILAVVEVTLVVAVVDLDLPEQALLAEL
jgi:hypothetical protein